MRSLTTNQPWRRGHLPVLALLAPMAFIIQGCMALKVRQPLPEHLLDQAQIPDIGPRAIGSLTKYQGVGDLYRIYVLTQRDGIDYNLAYIPVDFHPKRDSEFDTKYMNEEFNLAYNLACSGYKWSKYPPGYEPHGNDEKLRP